MNLSVGWTNQVNQQSKLSFNPARTVTRCAVSVDVKDLGMIDYPNVALNSFQYANGAKVSAILYS
jgi:hypothetical protein